MSGTTDREQRIDSILQAAIPVFAAQGYRKTTMADLAAAAGVSRPALYQYFDDRADLFRSAFDVVLRDSADAALAALDADGTVVERLEGYLQRAHGDGYEALSSTPHGDELMEARHGFATDVADAALERMRQGLRAFVESAVSPDGSARIIDLLLLSPTGLKSDHPSPETYRIRLRALAAAAAALIEAGRRWS